MGGVVLVSLGSQYWIDNGPDAPVLAEVVGFHGDRAYLMPVMRVDGLVSGARVTPVLTLEALPLLRDQHQHTASSPAAALFRLPIGPGLLGRVIGPFGEAIDAHGPLKGVRAQVLHRSPINAMARMPVREILDTGSRALDATQHQHLLTGLADLDRNTRDLQESVMSIRMIPMSIVFSRFPRMLRDLAGKLGKKVEFVTLAGLVQRSVNRRRALFDPDDRNRSAGHPQPIPALGQ